VIAEATTNVPRDEGVGRSREKGMAGDSRGEVSVEKLADYSIVKPVVSVNRNAPWTLLFFYALAACIQACIHLHVINPFPEF